MINNLKKNLKGGRMIRPKKYKNNDSVEMIDNIIELNNNENLVEERDLDDGFVDEINEIFFQERMNQIFINENNNSIIIDLGVLLQFLQTEEEFIDELLRRLEVSIDTDGNNSNNINYLRYKSIVDVLEEKIQNNEIQNTELLREFIDNLKYILRIGIYENRNIFSQALNGGKYKNKSTNVKKTKKTKKINDKRKTKKTRKTKDKRKTKKTKKNKKVKRKHTKINLKGG